VPETVQIIGLSATLSNADDLCKCLSASLYVTNFRPVPLSEFAKRDDCIYNRDGTVARKLPVLEIPRLFESKKHDITRMLGKYKNKAATAVAKVTHRDGDHIARLTHEITSQNKSVIIFCSTRASTEKVAKMVAEQLVNLRYLSASEVELRRFEELARKGIKIDMAEFERCLSNPPMMAGHREKKRGRLKLKAHLEKTSYGLDETLSECLDQGVCYHHAGDPILRF
jgi:replicative superfamily II helicase